ncbi:MAG: reverse transcriptase domain-containing protein [Candidatus Obscuribacterales bacterium]
MGEEQAVEAARKHIEGGYRVVVDIDLEKFFDRVNHDVLMNRVTKRISDKRVHKLIRAYLNAGALEGGLTSASKRGYHKADRFRRYSQTRCLISNLTENWNDGTFTLCDTQMTAISALSRQAGEARDERDHGVSRKTARATSEQGERCGGKALVRASLELTFTLAQSRCKTARGFKNLARFKQRIREPQPDQQKVKASVK